MSKSDHSQKIEQQLLDAALSNHKAKTFKPGAAFIHCQECGVEIPKQRRMAIKNCNTCVDCQELIESNLKHYRA
ncbi:TraR/DksA family transcriptional regulator [Pseudoalteromonas sp. Hal040]|uniref:TraR/DksA family transcriptional regulator n=1 Tax=unclassified Pseudoalteromonas TaxID=194690 RepID=UPI00301E4F53